MVNRVWAYHFGRGIAEIQIILELPEINLLILFY